MNWMKERNTERNEEWEMYIIETKYFGATNEKKMKRISIDLEVERANENEEVINNSELLDI